jgi:hypothetical protein
MKDLHAAVRADGSNGKIVFVVSFQNLLDIFFRNHGETLCSMTYETSGLAQR